MDLRELAKSFFYLPQRLLPRKSGALVLSYHSIARKTDPFTVNPVEFEWQLQEIQKSGLKIISLSDLESMLTIGVVEDKTVALTFDDGRRDNFEHLFPILKKYRVPVTIFSITGLIGGAFSGKSGDVPMLSEAQMWEMQSSGLIDFQPHTVTHPNLKKIALVMAKNEIESSKNTIEGMFKKECNYFAYPYGRYTKDIIEALPALGITLAFTTETGLVTTQSHPLALPRNGIDGITRAQFKGILAGGALW
jgi:peptidoglycan/xylan/chitin deacetylase (PgdA/CDA1 family)